MFRFLFFLCLLVLSLGSAPGQTNRWDIYLRSGLALDDVVPDTLRGDTLIVGVRGRAHVLPIADIRSIVHFGPDTGRISRAVRGAVTGSTIGIAAAALASSLTDPVDREHGSPDRTSEFWYYGPGFILG